MASRKGNLGDMLESKPSRPEIQRGQGYRLSTESEQSEEEVAGTRAHVHKSTKAQSPYRSTRGFRLRNDLVRACKRIAADEDCKLYEVMEEALEQYLRRKGLRS